MDGRTRRLGAVLIGAVAALGGFSGTAFAADPSCAVGFTDPSGDAKDRTAQVIRPTAAPDLGALPGQNNQDILDVKVLDSLDGSPSVEITINNLNQTVPADANNISWYFGYTIAGVDTPEFVSAESSGSGYTYQYGTYNKTASLYQSEGDTSGSVVEGPNGVITIALPDVFDGDTLTKIFAIAYQGQKIGSDSAASVTRLVTVDQAPDGGGEAAGATNAPDCVVSIPA
jgi:hypothetical protein